MAMRFASPKEGEAFKKRSTMRRIRLRAPGIFHGVVT
jgi:hypothetical protein